MAQDFERIFKSSISNNSGSPTTITTANSDDAIIGIRCVNKSSSAVTVTVQITDSGSTTYNVISAAPVPVGGSLELIDGGSKIVMQTGDVLKAFADTASAVDVLTSIVDSIST
tara:strand:+ start:2764 stop:3102 length:339 start_codon:yes stop_codon:yes gene_type:complete